MQRFARLDMMTAVREGRGRGGGEGAEALWVGIMNREGENERGSDKYQGSKAGAESMRHRYGGRQEAAFVFRFVNSCPPLGLQHTLSSGATNTPKCVERRRKETGIPSVQRLSE